MKILYRLFGTSLVIFFIGFKSTTADPFPSSSDYYQGTDYNSDPQLLSCLNQTTTPDTNDTQVNNQTCMDCTTVDCPPEFICEDQLIYSSAQETDEANTCPTMPTCVPVVNDTTTPPPTNQTNNGWNCTDDSSDPGTNQTQVNNQTCQFCTTFVCPSGYTCYDELITYPITEILGTNCFTGPRCLPIINETDPTPPHKKYSSHYRHYERYDSDEDSQNCSDEPACPGCDTVLCMSGFDCQIQNVSYSVGDPGGVNSCSTQPVCVPT